MIRAFFTGLLEFRRLVTSAFEGHEDAYDTGRELAHRITFRRYEP
jgi:hypothetical protein